MKYKTIKKVGEFESEILKLGNTFYIITFKNDYIINQIPTGKIKQEKYNSLYK